MSSVFEVSGVPWAWPANGEFLNAGERMAVGLLRLAGCACPDPLLGYRPAAGFRDVRIIAGPRCRLCGTEVSLKPC